MIDNITDYKISSVKVKKFRDGSCSTCEPACLITCHAIPTNIAARTRLDNTPNLLWGGRGVP